MNEDPIVQLSPQIKRTYKVDIHIDGDSLWGKEYINGDSNHAAGINWHWNWYEPVHVPTRTRIVDMYES